MLIIIVVITCFIIARSYIMHRDDIDPGAAQSKRWLTPPDYSTLSTRQEGTGEQREREQGESIAALARQQSGIPAPTFCIASAAEEPFNEGHEEALPDISRNLLHLREDEEIQGCLKM